MTTRTSAASGLASASGTWVGGIVPVEGDKVIIAAGHVVEIDGTYVWGDGSLTATIGNAAVNVSGTLKASRSVSSTLTTKGLMLVNFATQGFDYGTDADPIPKSVTATIKLNKLDTPSVQNGVQQLGASGAGNFVDWSFVGDNTRARGVPLASNATSASANILLTSSAHGWVVGDEILLFNTTNNSTSDECETRTVAGAAGATITLNSAPTFTHLAGSPACNLTCNVVLTSHSEVSGQMANPNIQIPAGGTIATAGYYYKFKNVLFRSFGSSGANTAAINGGGSPSTTNYGYTVTGCVFKNKITAASAFNVMSNKPTLVDNTVFYLNGNVFFSGAGLAINNSYAAVGEFKTSPESINSNNWITANGANSSLLGSLNTHVNSTISGRQTQVVANASISANLINCDVGATYGWKAVFGDNLFRLTSAFYQVGRCEVTEWVGNSVLATPSPAASVLNQGDSWVLTYANKNRDVTAQEIYYAAGTIKRDNATVHRSTSSIANAHYKVEAPLVRTLQIPVAIGATIRVIGYCQFNSAFYNAGDYYPPTVAIGGLGTDTDSYTATSSANSAWEKFDLTFTNNAGYAGSVTVTWTATAKTVTTGAVYFDGVPDLPFVTACRHYGFVFDEANPVRVVNPVIVAAEATAAAYTGVTITPATPEIVVASGTADTWQKVYDYSQAWACLNLTETVLLTSSDGQIFTLPLTCKLDWPAMPGDRTLSGGWLLLASTGVHSYRLSGTKIEFQAAGSYNMSGTTFAGTVELVNTSGGSVTVSVPTGTSYTNTGPDITVTTPTVTQSVTISGLTSGSTVQIYDTTNSVELANGTSATTFSWTDSSPAAGDRAIRVRIAYMSGATAKQFIEAAIGTCGTTSGTEALTYLASQVDDPVYIANAIDGSTVTGITINDGIDRMLINIAGGAVAWSQMYAYNVYWLATTTGIQDDGAIMTAVDTANYLVSGFLIRNTSATPLSITGGYGRDSATGTVASLIDVAGSTGNIYQTPDHVVAYATGSGLSPAESAQLMALPSAPANADALLSRSLAGSADGGRTVRDALRASRNKTAISGATLTVYAEDDTTPAWTATVTTAERDALSGIDPA